MMNSYTAKIIFTRPAAKIEVFRKLGMNALVERNYIKEILAQYETQLTELGYNYDCKRKKIYHPKVLNFIYAIFQSSEPNPPTDLQLINNKSYEKL